MGQNCVASPRYAHTLARAPGAAPRSAWSHRPAAFGAQGRCGRRAAAGGAKHHAGPAKPTARHTRAPPGSAPRHATRAALSRSESSAAGCTGGRQRHRHPPSALPAARAGERTCANRPAADRRRGWSARTCCPAARCGPAIGFACRGGLGRGIWLRVRKAGSEDVTG